MGAVVGVGTAVKGRCCCGGGSDGGIFIYFFQQVE
jgi:hypothetical protein